MNEVFKIQEIHTIEREKTVSTQQVHMVEACRARRAYVMYEK